MLDNKPNIKAEALEYQTGSYSTQKSIIPMNKLTSNSIPVVLPFVVWRIRIFQEESATGYTVAVNGVIKKNPT